MSLIDSLDAALAAAAEREAKPFRLELQPKQIEALKAHDALGDPPGKWVTALGGYKDVPVYRALQDSELLAQPPLPELYALHIPIKG
jgi:hypothetical protein